MRNIVAITACLLFAVASYAELQNVQVGCDMRIRAGGPPYLPGILAIPTLYESLLSVATDDRSSEPPPTTFGDISIEIGMDTQDVIDRLSTEFSVLATEPDRGLPTTQHYQIIGETDKDNDTYRGSFLVELGKVVRITMSLGRYDKSDAGSIMTAIVNTLEAAKSEDESTPRVDWSTGMRDGKKASNTKLKFEFEHMTIAVVYADSQPGASQRVSVTQTIGTRRWRSFPRAGDFQNE